MGVPCLLDALLIKRIVGEVCFKAHLLAVPFHVASAADLVGEGADKQPQIPGFTEASSKRGHAVVKQGLAYGQKLRIRIGNGKAILLKDILVVEQRDCILIDRHGILHSVDVAVFLRLRERIHALHITQVDQMTSFGVGNADGAGNIKNCGGVTCCDLCFDRGIVGGVAAALDCDFDVRVLFHALVCAPLRPFLLALFRNVPLPDNFNRLGDFRIGSL